MFNIDRRKKNILIIGAVLLVLAVVYRFAPVVGEAYLSDNELKLLAEQLAGSRQQLDKRKSLKGKTDYLEKILEKRESALFRAETPSLAAVEIQKILDGIIARNGLDLTSVQVLDSMNNKDNPYIRVPIRLTFTANISQLQQTMYAIETSERYLKVEEARFRTSSRSGGDSLISASLTVAGLMQVSQQRE